ncbi:MAG: restriction endonuclease subunit S [Nitrosomonadales bacterium]|nr:restriction endonuclease subunit S [Nitrosomonadales bacterium]
MKAGWPIKRLGDLSDLITKGTTPTSVGHAFVSDGVNFIKVESLSENGQFIEDKFAHITQECHAALKRSQLNDGDILFSIAGALGRTGLVHKDVLPANINQALAIIRLRKSNEVLPEFVLKALETGFLLEQIEKFKGGVAQQNLSLAQVQEFQIPLPSLPDQQRLVGILDEAFDGIATATANAEQNLQNARALFESHLQSVFTQRGEGWDETTLSAVASINSGAGFPLRHQGKVENGTPFYKVSDMNLPGNERIMENENNSITEKIRAELGATIFPSGSVIFPKIGGAIATNKKRLVGRPCCVDNNVMVATPRSGKITSEYLYYFFRSYNLSDFANDAHLPSIKKSTLENWKISVPIKLAAQEMIARQLDELDDEVDRLESLYQRKLAALDELKKSLLHQAFSGML